MDVALGISQNGSWLWWLNEEVIQIFCSLNVLYWVGLDDPQRAILTPMIL